MEHEITIAELADLCCYRTHIKVLSAASGKVVINGVNQLRYSKDKRQAAKWNAFKDRKVYGIRPTVQIEGIKRDDQFFLMCIECWISKCECEEAVEEYKACVT